MSLATRCTACGTAFRVVQDQLKVSEGWVRCGRCDAVFNALEGLFDLERAARPGATLAPELHAADASEVHPANPLEGSSDSTLTIEFQPMAADALAAREPEDSVKCALAAGVVETSGSRAPVPVEDASSSTPEFLRQPERDSRRGFARPRFALSAVSALLLSVLAAQAAHHFRDSISANWPFAKPTLVAWCKSAGCSVGALHRIADVAVENSALTRAAGRDAFTLAVLLRNRGRVAVAMPSLELSLTDSNGQLLVRRAMGPGDFHNETVIAAGADAALQLTLASDNLRTAGYAVEIFYP